MASIKKRIASLILAATTLCSLAFTGCDQILELLKGGDTPKSMIDQSMFLKAEGTLVKDANGETVYLRGVNAGGLFVTEQWMNGFKKTWAEDSKYVSQDYRTTTQVFLDRFGEEQTLQLWDIYRENWWSDIDFKNCAEMGINVIRLPFTYMNVDFDALKDLNNGGKKYDFSQITDFVNKAASYGIYTILDLHGAYGSQNGQDHSGEILDASKVDFYSNEQKQKLTIDLWRALAKHFKGNPAIAGYDILNEPAEKNSSGGTHTTGTKHWEFFDKVYDAIREVDKDHIVIFESCWDAQNLPLPSKYGWTNCMYSFHHYTSCTGQERTEEHNESMMNKLESIKKYNFGVPLQMGEFTCYENYNQWDYTLELFNKEGWHWCSWTYKINNTWSTSGWGVIQNKTTNNEKVDAHADSYDVIVEKFQKMKTNENTKYFQFSNGVHLYDLIYKYASGDEEFEL